jgi:hypothetical protein
MNRQKKRRLGKVYDILRGGKAGVIFPHDGTVLGEDELGS